MTILDTRQEMQHRPPPPARRQSKYPLAAVGAAATAVTVFVIYCILTLSIPFLPGGGQTVSAHLPDVVNARPGEPVRIDGVDKGTITGVQRAPDGDGGILTMNLDSSVHLHADATLALQWRTLFGWNMAVNIDPGSPSAPPLGGRQIPLDQTTSQVEFDQLLQPIDTNSRAAIETTFTQLARAFADPAAPRTDIALLQPTMINTSAVAALRGTQFGDLTRLTKALRTTTAALGSNEAALGGLVWSADSAVGVIAARRANLNTFLASSPGMLSTLGTSMQNTRAMLNQLAPLMHDLQPGARELAPSADSAIPAFERLGGVLQRLRPTLNVLDPTLGQLNDLARSGIPLSGQLNSILGTVRGQILPSLNRTDASTGLREFAEIGPWLGAAASMAGEFDSLGHWFRFEGGLGPNSLDAKTPGVTAACSVERGALRQGACQRVLGGIANLLAPAAGSTR
jgi:virulence factor Mce-like protein